MAGAEGLEGWDGAESAERSNFALGSKVRIRAGRESGLDTGNERMGWMARLVRHGRYAVFQRAEAALPRQAFAGILGLIDGLRGPPITAVAA